MKKLNILWDLFRTFIKIGGFTVGGGYAMIPIIQREAVEIKNWATEDEMADIITMGPSMPGVVGINIATALGTKVAKVPGALAAALGMVTPSVVIIMIIAWVLEDFQKILIIQYAFIGIRAAVAALMLNAVIRLTKTSVKDWFQITLFLASALLVIFAVIQTQYVLIICAASSIAYGVIRAGGINR